MNIIYFNPDEMRANVLACYGHPLIKTPNFDRLAAEGTLFEQCHVQHTVCSPSRASFTTGWYPHTRGHRTLWHLLQPDEPNTFRYLKENGYDTHWIGKNDCLSPGAVSAAISQNHRNAVPAEYAGDTKRLAEQGEPGYRSFLYSSITGDEGADYYKVEEAIRLLEERKPDDPPFMIFLALSQPHCPYTVPEPWYSMYNPADLPPLISREYELKPIFYRLIREYRELDRMSDDHLRRIMAVYLGMVSYVDHLLGRLLDALERTGLNNETAVFAFSDHGDWAGDYGLVEKWPSGLDDCLTHIPMIVRMPGGKPGHRVTEPVECFDIMPTTLELAGIEPNHSHWARSMIPQLRGAPGDPRRTVYAEGGYDQFEPQCFEGNEQDTLLANPDSNYYSKALQQQERPESVCRAVMARTSRYKLVRRTADINELYDLETDPHELHNVYDDPAYREVRDRMESEMLDWYIRTADSVPLHRDPRGF